MIEIMTEFRTTKFILSCIVNPDFPIELLHLQGMASP